jgi:trigger factor
MINFDIAMIEKQILPDFSDEEISKLFWNDKISTYKDLEAEVRRVLAEQKEQKEYAEVIEELVKTAEKEFDFEVPRTLIESDVKRRMEMMAKRAWWEEMFKKYLENIWEEQAKKMNDEMSASAEESLKKFFVLKSITDTLWFTEVDRNNTVELEKKLYDHFSGSKK